MFQYLLTHITIEYAKNYSNYSRAGIVGAVTKIDNYAFDYHLRIGDNSKIGIVGEIKKVGLTISLIKKITAVT